MGKNRALLYFESSSVVHFLFKVSSFFLEYIMCIFQHSCSFSSPHLHLLHII